MVGCHQVRASLTSQPDGLFLSLIADLDRPGMSAADQFDPEAFLVLELADSFSESECFLLLLIIQGDL